jgi:hypothetical protein
MSTGMQVRLMKESWKSIQFFYLHWKPRRKSRKNIQLGDPHFASYNHPFIAKLHTIINKFGILSILEPLGLQSISSEVIINL